MEESISYADIAEEPCPFGTVLPGLYNLTGDIPAGNGEYLKAHLTLYLLV